MATAEEVLAARGQVAPVPAEPVTIAGPTSKQLRDDLVAQIRHEMEAAAARLAVKSYPGGQLLSRWVRGQDAAQIAVWLVCTRHSNVQNRCEFHFAPTTQTILTEQSFRFDNPAWQRADSEMYEAAKCGLLLTADLGHLTTDALHGILAGLRELAA
jgi:hypothetical protein